METSRRFDRMLSHSNGLITAAFVLAVAAISYSLITQHPVSRWLYLGFPVAILVAFLHRRRKTKLAFAVLSLGIILLGSVIEPLEREAIEQVLLLLPLCFLVIMPGSFWPILAAIVLIACYLPAVQPGQFDSFAEDAFELLLISVFASVMAYFQKKARREALLYKRASHTDHLTGLRNSKAFFEDIGAIKPKVTSGRDYAVIQMAITNFRNANDALGYRCGDQLLVLFSQQIKNLIGKRGRFYRLSGDEFIVLMSAEQDLTESVNTLVDIFRFRYHCVYQIEDTSHELTFNAGIALLSDAGWNISLWGKNVDVAVDKAREKKGRINFQWFDQQLAQETIRNNQIAVDLKQAVKQNQLAVVYQPKVCVKTNQLVGAEALLRWNHPSLGKISPSEFVPIAERTAQIIPIGQWVLEQVCMQGMRWLRAGRPVCISVNVSPVQFSHDEVLPLVERCLATSGLPGHYLQLEITETTLMNEPEMVAFTCAKLRMLGVSIAIDDFGIAYSSLNYLKRLPVDVLKIDKFFVDECVEQKIDRMLIKTIIQMGHNLDKTVVAEGVEKAAQLTLLSEQGCDVYQGYLYSKPLEPDLFEQLLNNKTAKTRKA
ncbi:putative bifunctional diguanylate cyclase/phosphodiesterase [Vibrio sp.]|uniref:putative bifunctional diguanylate cyclase/phosphodiesterase n=1 Tax=Vibrio sp. TaxID=678 RepID=UPI003D12B40D